MKRLLALLLSVFPAPAAADVPTDAYRAVRVEGFRVLLGPGFRADPALRRATLAVLRDRLGHVRGLATPAQLRFFRTVPFWVENTTLPGGATYHWSADWLREHGDNPDKAGGIEIVNPRNFGLWATTDQPMSVVHELAHAYHARVLGQDHAPIAAAYRNAVDRHLYDPVPYVHGGLRRAYAMNEPREFFAELTEAWFGRNDFFPYDRADLARYDPVGYALMESVWGKTPSGTPSRRGT